MLIELFDMDEPYALQKDCNDEGKDFVRIMPLYEQGSRIDDYDICIDYDQCKELIRALQFLADEIKPSVFKEFQEAQRNGMEHFAKKWNDE